MEMGERGRRPVLFGYDGTDGNDAALRWAVEEARLRGRELVMCHCWHWPYPDGHDDPRIEAVTRRVGENLLAHGAARARELDGDVPVRTCLMAGPVPAALLHEAREAELIVVGAPEPETTAARPPLPELPARARRPVIAVRRDGGHRRVVAGVDGSAGADAALGLAFEEAALRGWSLRAVYGCWEPGAVDDSELGLFADRARLRRDRAAMLESVVGPWCEKYPDVDAAAVLRLEGPVRALLDAAEAAGLLVVGARGAGGPGPPPLGATGSAMLHQAHCAVAVVPAS